MADADSIKNGTSWNHKLLQYISVLKWLKNYGKFELFCDLISGISIAFTMIPQSIAYAAIIDLTPEYGLNSTFIGCILYSLFGSTKEVSIGPDSVISIVLMEYVYDLNGDFVILSTFLVACTEILMSFLQLGFIVDYISLPVRSGYISALAIIIACSQLKGIMGVQFKSKRFTSTIYNLISCASNTKLNDVLVGIFCIMFLLFFKFLGLIKIEKKSKIFITIKKLFWFLSTARNAIVVISAICFTSFLKNSYNKIPYHIIGKVKHGLPPVQFAPTYARVGNQYYSFIDMVKELNLSIITISVLSLFTNIFIAKAYHHGEVVESNKELFALGFCNLFSSFVGSMPVSGAITRSAIGSASNIQSPIAGIFTGIGSVLVLSIFTPYFNLIPRATLSAVLISCVVFLIDWPIMVPMWKSDRKDLMVMILTMIFCLSFGLANGLFLSVAVSMIRLFYLWSYPETEVTACLTVSGQKYVEIVLDKGLYFPAMKNLQTIISKQRKNMPIIVNCKNLSGLDFTALEEVYSLVTNFNEKGQKIVLINVNTKLKRKWNAVNTFNQPNSLLPFCSANCDIDKILFGNLSSHETKDITELKKCDSKEMIALISETKNIEEKEL
ncbi:sodium-independent sulfate anion transporter-like [Lycorma delicatula]|uniref:sodium-independent sulfate anion transporter-like n=1 Tax=Lycorma delicatula TaxID=130591 RepID=UPI003F517ACF